MLREFIFVGTKNRGGNVITRGVEELTIPDSD
jgi:hypothetical protein